MAKNKFIKRFAFPITIIFALLVGVASWSLYSLLNESIKSLLESLGITNFYFINGAIVLGVLILLILLGNPAKKSIKKLT